MSKVLDRSKPFQEVIGDDPSIKHRFLQDGVKFDNQGNEIVEKSAEKPKKATESDADEVEAARRAGLTDAEREAEDKAKAGAAKSGGKKGGGK